MIRDGVLYIDNSTLGTVACSTLALVQYGLGYRSREEAAYLQAGTAGHAAMEAFFTGQGVDAAMDAFRAEYEEYAAANVINPEDRLTFENTSTILQRWLDTHRLDDNGWLSLLNADGVWVATGIRFRPELVEIGFAYVLSDEGDIVFTGRMDAIVENAQGEWYTWENKFPGRIDAQWLREFQFGSQLSGYEWAAQQHTARRVVGGYLNAVEFSKLPGSTRRCQAHGTQYAECGPLHAKYELATTQRTPAQLTEWKKTALHLARRYRDLLLKYGVWRDGVLLAEPAEDALAQIAKVRTQGTFLYRMCGNCGLRDWCHAGRDPKRAASELQLKPWAPFDYAAQAAVTSGLVAATAPAEVTT